MKNYEPSLKGSENNSIVTSPNGAIELLSL